MDWAALEHACKQVVIFSLLWYGSTLLLEELGFVTRWTPLG